MIGFGQVEFGQKVQEVFMEQILFDVGSVEDLKQLSGVGA